ncbi:hypothetical protein [Tessaracoccus caeni]|uniref:hypothetical protein n=1 Tax=Tessaracoccus caeni TaxID=3031239 RepID=UPI0023DCC653|nr:hypothetical protein [Tessaracoccus caeni]MDF1487079.1 hypothetical protein [Tessaracoccus caeni]
MHLPRLAAAAVLLIGLVGCSSPDPAAPDTPPATTGSVSSAAPSASPDSDPSAEQQPSMPFDPYLAVIDSSRQQTHQEIADETNLMEETIAKCMREQGFEYLPKVVTVEDVEASEAERDAAEAGTDAYGRPPGYGTVDYAKKYGYGSPDLPDDEDTREEPRINPILEKEWAYLDSLTQSEREAWETALSGDMSNPLYDEDGNAYWDMTTQGCYGEGYQAIDDDEVHVYDDPAFTDLLEALSFAEPAPDNDKDFAALEKEWSSCMSDEGFSFPRRQDAAITVENEQDALWPRGADGKPDPAQEPTEEELERFFVEYELPVAIADATCAEGIDYDDRLRDITVAFQERFIKEHQDQLDDLVLRYGE